jgi:hypothetical protein
VTRLGLRALVESKHSPFGRSSGGPLRSAAATRELQVVRACTVNRMYEGGTQPWPSP